jgi:uncharacterized protein YdcH (DUF465 family)
VHELNTQGFDFLVKKIRYVDHALTAMAHGEEKVCSQSIEQLKLERILVITEIENILQKYRLYGRRALNVLIS